MRALALLHRWAGGVIGLFLAVLGLSGAILALEESWIGVAHAGDPLTEDTGSLARAVETALGAGDGLSRITFASEDLGVHQAIYGGGGGAYLSQSGEIVERWTSIWQRPELWLFELHHHLFIGKTGETLTGILGLIGLFFVVSGVVLWWRTRRTFRFRLWPARLTRSAIVRQHRDLGLVAAPFLMLTMLTGVLMVFDSLSRTLLAPWAGETAQTVRPAATATASVATDWDRALRAARGRFPDARYRRLQLPGGAGQPIVLRMKQPSEWTPNGRTYVYFDMAGRIVGADDPARGSAAQAIEEKYYPIHAAKVGGWPWRAIVCLTGIALAMLGMLTTYSFWWRRTPQKSAISATTSLRGIE